MKLNISIVKGPTVFDSNQSLLSKYLTIGLKYYLNENDNNELNEDNISQIINEIKNKLLEFKNNNLNENRIIEDETDVDFGIISLTDKFFEYIKSNDTKIQVFKVNLDDYRKDYLEQKLKTIKIKYMVVTADESSLNDVFDTIVKELYYEYGGDKVIDIYSIILTPIIYKIIDNVPVSYRGILIRVKK